LPQRSAGRLFEARRNERANADILGVRTEAGDQVIAGMNDPDPYVRQASLRAAGEMGNERAVQSLIDLLAYYKTATLGGSRSRRSPESRTRSLSVLTALLESKDQQSRALASRGLADGRQDRLLNLESVLRATNHSTSTAMAFARCVAATCPGRDAGGRIHQVEACPGGIRLFLELGRS